MSVWIATCRAVSNNTSKVLVESVRCYTMPCQPSDSINGRFNLYRIPIFQNIALRAVEQWHIGKLNTKHPDGYNMREGSNPNLKQKRAKHLTPAAKCRAELKSQVRERREQGVLLETIADEFDISRGTVFEWCKGVKVVKDTIRRRCEQRRAEKAAKNAKLRIKALQLKEKGLSLREIADELDSNPSKIRRLLLQK